MPKAKKLPYFRCYLLYSKLINRTYIGYTNKTYRLEQHLGKRSGGARATKKMTDAIEVCFVEPFTEKTDALSFERAWKNASTNKKLSVIERRIESARKLLDPARSTWKRLKEDHKNVKVTILLDD